MIKIHALCATNTCGLGRHAGMSWLRLWDTKLCPAGKTLRVSRFSNPVHSKQFHAYLKQRRTKDRCNCTADVTWRHHHHHHYATLCSMRMSSASRCLTSASDLVRLACRVAICRKLLTKSDHSHDENTNTRDGNDSEDDADDEDARLNHDHSQTLLFDFDWYSCR